MKQKPRYAKAHAQAVADEYVRLGWSLRHQFFAPGDDEPYEYFLEWLQDAEPVSIDWPTLREKLRQEARAV